MKDIKSTLKEAREAIKNKDFATCMQLSKCVLKEDKTNYMALVFLGLSLQEIGPEGQAPNAFKKAIQSNSTNPLAWNGLVNYYEKIDNEEARKELIKAYMKLVELETTENKLLEYCEKLSILCEFGDIEQISNIIHKVITDKDKTDIEIKLRIILAIMFSKVKDYPLSLISVHEDCLKSLIQTENIDVHNYYADYLMLLNKLDRFHELLVIAENMHTKFPNDTLPLSWICKIYNELYVEENSIFVVFEINIQERYRKLLELEPENAVALFTKSILLFKENKVLEAKDLVKDVLSQRPGLIHAWFFLISVCIRLNLINEGEHSIRKAQKFLQSVNFSNPVLTKKFEVMYVELLSKSDKVDDCQKAVNLYIKITDIEAKNKCIPYIIDCYINLEKHAEAKLLISDIKKDVYFSKILTAKLFYKQEEYEEALKILENDNYEDSLWYYFKGLCYWNLEQFSKCLVPFLKAVKCDPNNYKIFLHLGAYYKKFGDLDKARRCYEKCFKINQSCSEAGIELSKIYRHLKNWDANLNLLQSLTSGTIKREYSWAWLQLGLHYLEQEDYDKAIDNLRFVVRIDSENMHCWESLADAYFIRGSYTSALKSYQKASDLSQNTSLYSALQVANIKKILGEYTEAKSDFEEILSKNDLYVPALKGLAETSMNLAKQCYRDQRLGTARDHAQYAIDKLTLAVQQRSELSCLWKLLADCCVFVTKLPEKYCCLLFKKIVTQGLQADGNDILEMEELFQFGTKCYCKAISLVEDNILIWHDLAVCYLSHAMNTKEPDKNDQLMICAMAAAQHCTSVCSSHWPSWNLIGNISMLRDPPNYGMAQHAFIKSVMLDNNNAVAWCNLGILYLLKNDIKLANQAFSNGQRSDPNYVNSWIGQALLAEAIQPEEAMDLFRHSTQLAANQQGAIGYGQWVCKTLQESPPDAVIYSIHNMHAVPVACDALTWYTEKNPYDSCAWNMLGILKERMGLRQGSLAAFKNAYRLSSKNQRDKARVNYGRLLSKSGRYQEAIEMFQDVEAATFNSGSGLALALFENQQYEESYSAYESALHWLTEEQSSQSDLLVALASMAYKFQGPGEAKTLLFQSIALRSPSPWSLYATLSLALVHNDLKLAKLVLNEMDEFKDKKDCLYHYSVLLSYVYISKGEYVAAIREISKLVHRHPDHVGVWLTLALLFIRLEDHIKWSPAAAKCALLVMKLGQTNMDVTKVLCLVSLASHISGDDKQALKAAQKAIHCYPNVAEGWAVLAFALKNNVKKIQLTPKFLKLIFKHIESLNPSEILLHWVHNRINKIK